SKTEADKLLRILNQRMQIETTIPKNNTVNYNRLQTDKDLEYMWKFSQLLIRGSQVQVLKGEPRRKGLELSRSFFLREFISTYCFRILHYLNLVKQSLPVIAD